MRWTTHGLIFRPDHQADWMVSHASLPVADPRRDGSLRIYFGTRDAAGLSHIGYVDVDAGLPQGLLSRPERRHLFAGGLLAIARHVTVPAVREHPDDVQASPPRRGGHPSRVPRIPHARPVPARVDLHGHAKPPT